LGFTQAAGSGDHHFLSADRVPGHVAAPGTPAAPPRIDAVGIAARIVPAAAVDRADTASDVAPDVARISGGAHPGNQGCDGRGVPPAGDRSENVLTHRLLHLRALHVDDWCLAGDRNRLFERAHFHLAIHRGDERARQLDAFAFNGTEPR